LIGVGQIALGRVFDYFDGLIADKTGTKSPIGEAANVVADKIANLAIVSTLESNDILPKYLRHFLMIQNSTNTVLGIRSKLKHEELHSSKNGKIATFLQSGLFSVGLVDGAIDKEKYPKTKKALSLAELIIALPTIAYFIASTYDYINGTAKKPN